eukprot:m.90361 g.90361  ORF g.90361 m.90361 type:complete len:67 (-) comp9856_c0_seq1:266-466(-)
MNHGSRSTVDESSGIDAWSIHDVGSYVNNNYWIIFSVCALLMTVPPRNANHDERDSGNHAAGSCNG